MIAIRADFGLYLGIAVYELVMAFAYNHFTAWLERNGYLEGFTSLLVTGGVGLTLIPWIVFDLPSWTIVGGFVMSGLPMICGSISRYAKQRSEARLVLARLNAYGDEPTDLAE